MRTEVVFVLNTADQLESLRFEVVRSDPLAGFGSAGGSGGGAVVRASRLSRAASAGAVTFAATATGGSKAEETEAVEGDRMVYEFTAVKVPSKRQNALIELMRSMAKSGG